MLVVNQRHLEAILREYCAHYDDGRPHRPRSLRPPASRGDPILPIDGPIMRNSRLGGYSTSIAARRWQHDIMLLNLTRPLTLRTIVLCRKERPTAKRAALSAARLDPDSAIL